MYIVHCIVFLAAVTGREAQPQGQESRAPAQQTQPNFLTAFVTANPSAAGAIVVAILVLAYAGLRMHRKNAYKKQLTIPVRCFSS